ncbi:MAG: hypothetical protein ACK526_09035 [Planctomyces sp.]|jgi:hypothetical protein
MKRRPFAPSDSLELLLDTICNTFGAVIFISILVAILVSRSRPQGSQSESQDEITAFVDTQMQEIREAQQRRQILSLQLSQQRELVDRFSSEESVKLAADIRNTTLNRARILKDSAEALKSVTEAEVQAIQVAAEMRMRKQQLENLEKENKTLQQDLQHSIVVSSRTARIPQVRRTDKQSVAYILHTGRLFCATNELGQLDDVDCMIEDTGGVTTLEPRPGAGIAVFATDDQLKTRFQKVNNSKHFAKLFVSRDSFSHFLTVKDTLIELGLQYEVIIFDRDQNTLFLSDQQRESFVQ